VFVTERILWVGSLPHDIIYQTQGMTNRLAGFRIERAGRVQIEEGRLSQWRPITSVSRRYADRLFLHLSLAVGASRWRARAAYWGVRSPFGSWAWRERDQPKTIDLT
jgi:hypothetical protein